MYKHGSKCSNCPLNLCVFTTGLVDSEIVRVGPILKTFNFWAEAEGLPKLTDVRSRFVFFLMHYFPILFAFIIYSK